MMSPPTETKNRGWTGSLHLPIYVSLGYGLLASVTFYLARYLGQNGRPETYAVFYLVSLPVSWVVNQILSHCHRLISQRYLPFFYVLGVILAGMVWFFMIAWLIKILAAKLKKRP